MRLLPLLALVLVAFVGAPSPTAAQTLETKVLVCDNSLVQGQPYPTNSLLDETTWYGFPMQKRMETTYFVNSPPKEAFGGCWGHYSVFQWFLGETQLYTLNSADLKVYWVEAEASPPAGVPQVEVSRDSITWHLLVPTLVTNAGTYDGGELNVPGVQYHMKFGAESDTFRFLRIRGPASATQGLAGFVDFARGRVDLVPAGSVPSAPMPLPTTTRSCATDLMEDLYLAHPCWYGGVNDYDSASALHTYFLGAANVLAVHGTVEAQVYRHFINPLGEVDLGAARLGLDDNTLAAGHTNVTIQISPNGRDWQNVCKFSANYLESTSIPSSCALPSKTPAMFVRLAAQKHPRYDDFYNGYTHGTGPNAAYHRTESYLMDSSLSLDGDFSAYAPLNQAQQVGLPALP